ncbi:GntR family transcriptional regulator [Gluconobacter thailandicus]|nr:GntR family transcriptional regulator [Gluconobacter thailandicus]
MACFRDSAWRTGMDGVWNDSQPIYQQLRDKVAGMMLDGAVGEGDPVPSVRQVAADCQINPLTVMKAYQQLSDEGLLEKRRGLGMFVAPGALERLAQSEREKFLTEQWPETLRTIRRLGLSVNDLLQSGDGE